MRPSVHPGTRARALAAGLLPLTLSLLLSLPGISCQAGYVWKQGWGQLARLRRQQPLDDPEVREGLTPHQLRLLDEVPRILEFCREELGLEPGDAYTSFLDTDGEPVSWVIRAAHPVALAPYLWCFPFVGCVPYKGFFDPDDAYREAAAARNAGWDVCVFPVGAYSTLGWFPDPILSTMLDDTLPGFVDLLIHETVHHTVFWPGETTANESLASHVASEGAKLYFERYPDAVTSDELAAQESYTQRLREDLALLIRTRNDLESIYATDRPEEEKRRLKREVFARANRSRARLHGRFVPLQASNASILSTADYSDLIPTFRELQRTQGGHPRDLMAYLKRQREETSDLPESIRARTAP